MIINWNSKGEEEEGECGRELGGKEEGEWEEEVWRDGKWKIAKKNLIHESHKNTQHTEKTRRLPLKGLARGGEMTATFVKKKKNKNLDIENST